MVGRDWGRCENAREWIKAGMKNATAIVSAREFGCDAGRSNRSPSSRNGDLSAGDVRCVTKRNNRCDTACGLCAEVAGGLRVDHGRTDVFDRLSTEQRYGNITRGKGGGA